MGDERPREVCAQLRNMAWNGTTKAVIVSLTLGKLLTLMLLALFVPFRHSGCTFGTLESVR